VPNVDDQEHNKTKGAIIPAKGRVKETGNYYIVCTKASILASLLG